MYRLIRAYDGFDYEFLQLSKDKSVLTFGYVDYEKIKGEKGKNVFGAVTYADGKSSLDKIEMTKTRGNDRIRILPGKSGNVLIVEYLSKEKQLDLRLEKLNF